MTGDFSYEEEFFGDAVGAWTGVAQTLADANNAAREIPRIPKIWSRNGRINDAIGTLNEMATLIQRNLLQVGSYRVESVARTVERIGNEYVGTDNNNIDISRGWLAEPPTTAPASIPGAHQVR